MKTTAKTDTAKFFCGFEAFHAIASGYFWLTSSSLTFGGYAFGTGWMAAGFFVHGAIAALLAYYSWGGQAVVGRAPPGRLGGVV